MHVVDAASIEGRDPVEAIKIMQKELSDYSHELTKKPCIIAANKIDLNYGDDSVIKKLRALRKEQEAALLKARKQRSSRSYEK